MLVRGKFKQYYHLKTDSVCVQVQFWTTELEKMQKRHEGQPKHVKQGSLSSSSSNSTVSSIASKYDVNQLKKEISQAKSRVCKHSRSFVSIIFISQRVVFVCSLERKLDTGLTKEIYVHT